MPMASHEIAESPPGKILFLGKRFYTNKDALEERFGRIFHLPSEWSKAGQRVFLWLIDYHSRKPVRRLLDGMEIASTPVLSAAMLKSAVSVLMRARPTIIVASGDCYIGLLGWALARLVGARFVFDVYDKYDEFEGYRKPFGLDLFGFLLKRADLCLYASRALAVRLSPFRGGGAVDVVPNGVDGEMFHPMDTASCRNALGLASDQILVGYFGGMEPDRGVQDLVEAIGLVRNHGQDVRLLVCGREHPATKLDHAWIDYRGMVAHEQMPLYINAADLLVVPYRLSEFMDMGASCKIAEFLMCRRPLVSTTTPNLTANFPLQAAELGASLCRPSDPRDLASAISHQLSYRVVASSPTGFTWPEIAIQALDVIKQNAENGSHVG